MKKLFAILLSLCLCLAALCAAAEAPAITIEELVAANLREVLLTRHESILCLFIYEDVVEGQEYNTRNLVIYSPGSMTDADGDWTLMDNDLTYKWYIMSDEERDAVRETPEEYEPVIYPEGTLEETIVSIEDNGDGTLTIVTVAGPSEEEEGAEEAYVYVVRADNLEIITESSALKKGEDIEIELISAFTYDVPMPEELVAFKARVDAYKSEPLRNPRTITAIYDYGTPEEETYTITAGEDCLAQVYIRSNYSMYNDPEKTSPYVSGVTGDKTIYLFPDAAE